MSAELSPRGDAIVAFLVAMNAHAQAEIAAIEDPFLQATVRSFWHTMVPSAVELCAHVYRRTR